MSIGACTYRYEWNYNVLSIDGIYVYQKDDYYMMNSKDGKQIKWNPTEADKLANDWDICNRKPNI